MHGFLNELDLSSFQPPFFLFATGKLTSRLCKLFSAQNVLSQRITFVVNPEELTHHQNVETGQIILEIKRVFSTVTHFQEHVGWGPRLAPYPFVIL